LLFGLLADFNLPVQVLVNLVVTVQVLEVKNAWSYCVELWSNSGMSLSVEGSPFCDFLKEGSGWPVL